MKNRARVIAALFIIIVAGCLLWRFFMAGSNPPASAEERELALGNNRFAFACLGALKGESGQTSPAKNAFFSPYSIRAALGMAYAGAKGETAKQMRAALNFTLPDDKLHPAFGESNRNLRARCGGSSKLGICNGLWLRQGAELLPAYREMLAKNYATEAYLADFRNDPEGARNRINQWICDNTGQLIKDAVASGMPSKEDRLLLVNLVYFKMEWQDKFNPNRTAREPFYLDNTREVRVSFMQRKEKIKLPLYCGDGFRMAELNYKGGRFSMLVLLPDQMDGLAGLEKKLDAESFSSWVEGLQDELVELWLPKFKMDYASIELGPKGSGLLSKQGMADAFSFNAADFSNICGDNDIFISSVLHKAVVAVSEEGTEAAAGTIAIAEAKAMKMPQQDKSIFHADHPFLFLIRDKESGSILFLGRMMNPAERECVLH